MSTTPRTQPNNGETEAQAIVLDDEPPDEQPARPPQQRSSPARKRQRTAQEVKADVELAKKEHNYMEISSSDDEPIAATSAPAAPTSAPRSGHAQSFPASCAKLGEQCASAERRH